MPSKFAIEICVRFTTVAYLGGVQRCPSTRVALPIF